MKRSLLLLLWVSHLINGQTKKPNLQDLSAWEITNRVAQAVDESGKKAIQFNELPNEGFMLLKDYEFSTGIIEFDVKGKNVVQRSFVGIAFHVQDEKTYDAIYFRPFNFMNPDTIRRPRSVQYMSLPDHSWEVLREKFPGKYENKVSPLPDPDNWFHVKIIIDDVNIKVFVNNSKKACLEVTKLTNTHKGKIGLWLGNNSGGSFANVVLTPTKSKKKISYGNNSRTGKYVNVGDAKLYCETYGKGKPIVLLHGGVYGYIDEFEPFISRLSKNYKVICLATRGHGKSEIGTLPFTWQQRAEDAYKVIRSITKDSVIILGFSDGAYSGYKLAALHPEIVKKLIAIGASDRPQGIHPEQSAYTTEKLLAEAKNLFESRLALMPEPARWEECLTKLNRLYNEDFISMETFEKIKCSTLVMSGDKDRYHSVEDATRASKMILGSQLNIIKGCDHVVFFCDFASVWDGVFNFLNR